MKYYFYITSIALLLFVPLGVFAQLGPGDGLSGANGGGCSGDCQAPTFGKSQDGLRFVEYGVVINDKIYQGELFSQKIDSNLVVGQNQIIFQIYENTGVGNIQFVELGLANYETRPFGVVVDNSPNKISWDKNTGVKITDNNQMLEDVDVTFKPLDNFNAIITFDFEIKGQLDSNVIKVRMWDFDRNSWNNYMTLDDIEIPIVDIAEYSEKAAELSFDGDQSGARDQLQTIRSVDPTNVKASLDTARTYFNEYDLEAALDEVEQTLKTDSTYHDALGFKATILSMLDRNEEAETVAMDALAFDKDNSYALLSQALNQMKQNNLKAAEAKVNRVLELEPEQTHAPIVKAEILMENGNPIDAAINAEKGMSYFPEDTLALEIKQETMIPAFIIFLVIFPIAALGVYKVCQKGLSAPVPISR